MGHVASNINLMLAVAKALGPGTFKHVMPLLVDAKGKTVQLDKQLCTMKTLMRLAKANLTLESKAEMLESMEHFRTGDLHTKMLAVLGEPSIVDELVEKLASVEFDQAMETPTHL